MVPLKLSISDMMGVLICRIGRTAIRIFKQYPYLKKKPYWVNHFWVPGYCVDPVGLDEEMIRMYVNTKKRKNANKKNSCILIFHNNIW